MFIYLRPPPFLVKTTFRVRCLYSYLVDDHNTLKDITECEDATVIKTKFLTLFLKNVRYHFVFHKFLTQIKYFLHAICFSSCSQVHLFNSNKPNKNFKNCYSFLYFILFLFQSLGAPKFVSREDLLDSHWGLLDKAGIWPQKSTVLDVDGRKQDRAFLLSSSLSPIPMSTVITSLWVFLL